MVLRGSPASSARGGRSPAGLPLWQTRTLLLRGSVVFLEKMRKRTSGVLASVRAKKPTSASNTMVGFIFPNSMLLEEVQCFNN